MQGAKLVILLPLYMAGRLAELFQRKRIFMQFSWEKPKKEDCKRGVNTQRHSLVSFLDQFWWRTTVSSVFNILPSWKFAGARVRA